MLKRTKSTESDSLQDRLTHTEVAPEIARPYLQIVENGYTVLTPEGERPIPLAATPIGFPEQFVEEAKQSAVAIAQIKRLLVYALVNREQIDVPKLQAVADSYWEIVTDGLPQITYEIISTVGDSGHSIGLWRQDIFPSKNKVVAIETNAGEPQGSTPVTLAHQANLQIVGKESPCLAHKIEQLTKMPTPFDLSLELITQQWEGLATVEGLPQKPNIGILVMSQYGLSPIEAQHFKKYLQQKGYKGIVFQPKDIVGIQVVKNANGVPIYILEVASPDAQQETVQIHMVRRLAGEPFEHLKAWEETKGKLSQITVQANAPELPTNGWEAFLHFSRLQMLNPLLSLATSKILDAFISSGNSEDLVALLQWAYQKMNPHLPEATSINLQEAINKAKQNIPETRIFAQLNDLDIAALKQDINWVVKFNPLEGASGTDIFVGPYLNLEEVLDLFNKGVFSTSQENFIAWIMRKIEEWQNEELITAFTQLITEYEQGSLDYARWKAQYPGAYKSLRSIFWAGLITFIQTTHPDKNKVLIQRFYEPDTHQDISIIFIDETGNLIERILPEAVADFDPFVALQGADVQGLYPGVTRVTAKQIGKTNVSTGYGGVGTPIY